MRTDTIPGTTLVTRLTVVSLYPAEVHMMLTLPGVADTYTFLMNTWNTLLESY
jgi:hypothetical protein